MTMTTIAIGIDVVVNLFAMDILMCQIAIVPYCSIS